MNLPTFTLFSIWLAQLVIYMLCIALSKSILLGIILVATRQILEVGTAIIDALGLCSKPKM